MTKGTREKKLVHAVKQMKAAKIRMLRSTASFHGWTRKAEYHKRMLDAEEIERENTKFLNSYSASNTFTPGRKFRD